MKTKKDKLDKVTAIHVQPDVGHINVGRAPLEASIGRSQKILRTYAGDSVARTCLQAAGFDKHIYEEGFRLLRRAYGEREHVPSTPEDPRVELVARVEAETPALFGRAHAVLQRFYPAQSAFVFDGLAAGNGVASILAMQTFLDRIDALENGTRKADDKEDRAAVAALQARGITPELRAQTRKLCQEAESAPSSVKQVSAPVSDERELRLRELYAWVVDWSETARCVISDKRILRRMGIGKRRARTPKKEVPPPVPTPGPTPTPIPPAVAGAPETAAE